MNKMELIDVMADKAGITKKDAEKALNAFIAITEETLKSGNKVQLIGFGTFETVKRAARNGINPQTKEACARKNVPKFTAGASLKKIVK